MLFLAEKQPKMNDVQAGKDWCTYIVMERRKSPLRFDDMRVKLH